ncbi:MULTISPECIES: hypothetical protein [unclassified Streptomyces]|uniref:hypothetical protein n=1 Tax=unclassified Streptomyces TaxID=2593676 RepID=UPI000805213F|nr:MULTISPECIES: hypothetical protein [unclassified Streptomyces]MYR75123.1 hypothetical protein [Streptomyces sp. SID4925]SBU97988.1 hypothetical protein YUMDRAFT_05993 [Streptomyces sp. OspMP-M45]
MSAREIKTPEQLAIELMTSVQSMKNGEPDARRLLHELQRNWLHEAARLMESAGYDDDAINWLDAYADYDPAGEAASSKKDITAGLVGLFERLGPPAGQLKPDAIEYGTAFKSADQDEIEVHTPTSSREEAEARVSRYLDMYPTAHLVQRTVRHGEWTGAATP